MTLPTHIADELSQAIYQTFSRSTRDIAAVDIAARAVFTRRWAAYLAETTELDAVIDRLHTENASLRAENAVLLATVHRLHVEVEKEHAWRNAVATQIAELLAQNIRMAPNVVDAAASPATSADELTDIAISYRDTDAALCRVAASNLPY
mgnify:CR=1 FL=1